MEGKRMRGQMGMEGENKTEKGRIPHLKANSCDPPHAVPPRLFEPLNRKVVDGMSFVG